MEPRRWDDKPTRAPRSGLRQPREPRRCDILKAAHIRRGITRRELDREREAVRRFILDGHVARGFTSGQLLELTRQTAAAVQTSS
jgi:hypothetical protein